MSTSLSGELTQVFDGLKSAMEEIGRDHEVVLVAKVSNACPEDPASEHWEGCGPSPEAGRANSMRRE